MNKMLRCGVLAALGFTSVVLAQTPTTQGTRPNPAPATSPAEGTAPASTQTTQGTQGRAGMTQDSKLVGAKVVTPADAPLGSVVDVVFDAKGQPSFVVIQSQNDTAAVPYSAASSMMKGNKVVMDQWRFERAPKVKQGEWRNQASGTWKNDAAKYWEKG